MIYRNHAVQAIDHNISGMPWQILMILLSTSMLLGMPYMIGIVSRPSEVTIKAKVQGHGHFEDLTSENGMFLLETCMFYYF